MPAVQLMALRGNMGWENSLSIAEEWRVHQPFIITRNPILLLCITGVPEIPNHNLSVAVFPISFHHSLP